MLGEISFFGQDTVTISLKSAKLLNIEVIGTLGLLKIAKNRGVILSVKKVIGDMLAEGYYIEDKLITRILEDASES